MQEINQLPREFYSRIHDIIEVARYADAVQDQVAETMFMQVLVPDLIMAVRSTPTALTLEQKVDYAHRYWTARHPGQQLTAYPLGPKP